MSLDTICSHCLEPIKVQADLRSLETKELPENFTQPVSITLPVSGKTINLRLLTVEDEIETERHAKKHPKEAMVYRYARTIVSEQDIIQKMAMLNAMDAKDYMTVLAFQDSYFHGPIMSTKFVCSNPLCKEEDEVDIPFRLELFFPDLTQFQLPHGA